MKAFLAERIYNDRHGVKKFSPIETTHRSNTGHNASYNEMRHQASNMILMLGFTLLCKRALPVPQVWLASCFLPHMVIMADSGAKIYGECMSLENENRGPSFTNS